MSLLFPFRPLRLLLRLLPVVLGLALVSSLSAAAPSYKITDLGIPSGYSDTEAVAINNSGQIAGNVYDGDNHQHAFLYANGAFTVIPTPSGFYTMRATGINNSGEVIGIMLANGGAYFGFAYANGSLQQLASVDSQDNSATAINASGVIVGDSDIITPYIGVDAWIFPGSDLGTLSGYAGSGAEGIDSAGRVLIAEDVGPPTFEGSELFLYSGGKFTDLGIDAGYETPTMNAAGMIVGQFDTNAHPFLYANGTLTDLSTKGMNSESSPRGINSAGTIIGTSFVYTGGTQYFLFGLNISGISAWNIDSISMTCINDSGQIAGGGYLEGGSTEHLMLLTPASGGGGGGGGSAPVINTQPASKSVNLGASATFNVVATGSGTLKYQWYFNTTTKIPGATKSSYAISTTSSASAGTYAVVVTNTSGSVTSAKATLAVVVPLPVITTAPVSTTVKAAATATFKIVAAKQTGVTFLYQWQRLPAGTSVWVNLANTAPYSGVTTASLTVKNITAKMSGDQFRCVVSDSGGSKASTAAQLLVQSAPAIIFQPVNATVEASQPASFVIVSAGLPTPSYQWQRLPAGSSKWGNLTNTGPYSGVTTSTLALNTTTLAMSGDKFNCVLKNTFGSITSANATLTVTPFPSAISASPSNQTANVGDNAIFSASATGIPAPALQWQISTDGGNTWSNLSANATFSGVTTTSLSVSNLAANLSGDAFRCLAINPAATATSDPAVLIVHYPPVFTLQPASTQALEGSNAIFTVSASGFPVPSLQWQISLDSGVTWSNLTDTGIFFGSATANLSLFDVTNDASGDQFRCVAANSVGSTTSSAATFTIPNAAPVIVSQASALFANVNYEELVFVDATGTPTPTCQWQVSIDGGLTWKNLTDDGVNYSGTSTLILHMLDPLLTMTGYEYRCTIANFLSSVTTKPMTLTVLNSPPVHLHPI